MKFSYTAANITEKEVADIVHKLTPYIEKLNQISTKKVYEDFESSINLPFDENIIKECLDLKHKLVTNKLKYLILIGIGGSNLGTKAVYDALHGSYDLEEPDRFPKIIFLDTINEKYMQKVVKFISQNIKDPEEILVNVISKSGSTMETNINLDYVTSSLPVTKGRVVYTTVKDTDFWKRCMNEKEHSLTMPSMVGGRYSFFTNVGMFPLACVGIDIVELAKGAMEMRRACIDKDATNNPALLSTAAMYLNFIKGAIATNFFTFVPELETLGKWYRQLVGESLGKEFDLDGKKVNTGILPIVSVGTNDLHSIVQLYIGGPKNIFTNFVYTESTTTHPYLSAILEGVQKTYLKRELPFTNTILNGISPLELGKFMQFKMLEIMYTAKLLNVNAFDQPNVEEYKQEAKNHL